MLRQDFPILNDKDNPVVYLDNAATTQKPQAVVNAQCHAAVSARR